MITTRQNIDSLNMMMVYEANYRRLMQLVPDLRLINGVLVICTEGAPEIHLSVVERCRYTTTLVLTHQLDIAGTIVPDLHMKVRVYHDARVAEVIGYQHQSRFANYYPYPNPLMRHHFEKRQVNLFFSEWLKYCSTRGREFFLRTL